MTYPLSIRLQETVYNDREILRYMGVREEASAEISALLTACKCECEGIFTPAFCKEICDVQIEGDTVCLGETPLRSADLAKCLTGCRRAILFVATIGIGIDHLIKKYSTLSPSRALTLSAIGTERIECLCDLLCTEWSREYGGTLPRYGIGYGDLSLDCQPVVFARLHATRRIGVTLTDSNLMTPTKSVSAIVGIDGHQNKL